MATVCLPAAPTQQMQQRLAQLGTTVPAVNSGSTVSPQNAGWGKGEWLLGAGVGRAGVAVDLGNAIPGWVDVRCFRKILPHGPELAVPVCLGCRPS